MWKLVDVLVCSCGNIRITKNSDDGEYRVWVQGRPETEYFTDDFDDAVGTAEHMAKELEQNG